MARTMTETRATAGGRAVSLFWQEGAAKLPFFQALLILLLSVDVALILLHVLYLNFETFGKFIYSIEHEDGYGELYQAIKGGWIALTFLWLGRNRRMPAYLVWSAFFFYLTLDDFFGVHETVGLWLAETFHIPAMFGLRNVDLGELTVYVLVALLFLPLFALAYQRGGAIFRRDSRTLIGLLVLLGGFGAGVDMVHTWFAETVLSTTIGLIEDGGEMIVMTIIVWFALLVLARDTLSPSPKG